MRKIEIEIGAIEVENPVARLPGEVGTATLLEDLAPKACRALWEALPIETRTIHVFWQGQAWRTEGNYPLLPVNELPENPASETQLVPGDIVYFAPRNTGLFKVMMVYGRASAGRDVQACLIAKVEGNLEGLVRMSRRILYEGPKIVSIRRAGD